MRRARIAAWAVVACIATGGAQAEVVTELYGRAGPTPESEREALRGWLRAMGAAAPVATPHVALSPPPRQPTGVAPTITTPPNIIELIAWTDGASTTQAGSAS